jgi:hypothetical protein
MRLRRASEAVDLIARISKPAQDLVGPVRVGAG